MNGPMVVVLPSANRTPMSSNTRTIGVIHQALRSQRKPNKSFKKSILVQVL